MAETACFIREQNTGWWQAAYKFDPNETSPVTR